MDPITDEELTDLAERWPFINADGPVVRRLIDSLRAKRANADAYQDEAATTIRRLAAELRDSREEVERLKGYDHAAFFPTLVVPAGGVTIAGPLSEPLLLVPAPPEG